MLRCKNLLYKALTLSSISRIMNCAWGRSSAGRALEWHSRGQGFDPPRLHHETYMQGLTDASLGEASFFVAIIKKLFMRMNSFFDA